MAADVFGAARKASVRMHPGGGVSRPGERSEGFDLLEVFERPAVMLHVEGLREGQNRRRPHGVVKRLRAADAAARTARHGTAVLLQFPESFG